MGVGSSGGADVGVYVNLGANISRTGSILITDPTLATLDPALDAAYGFAELRGVMIQGTARLVDDPGWSPDPRGAGLALRVFACQTSSALAARGSERLRAAAEPSAPADGRGRDPVPPLRGRRHRREPLARRRPHVVDAGRGPRRRQPGRLSRWLRLW